MPRDHAETIRALRAKAADKTVTPEESAAFKAKADELEAKYGNSSSPPTDETTVNMADEAVRRLWEDILRPTWQRPTTVRPSNQAWEEVRRLAENQWQWNDKYYDRWGNPRKTEADQDDLYEEQYKYAPGEDEQP